VQTPPRTLLGRAGLSVTRLGLGGGPIGGLFAPVSEAQAHSAVDEAWTRGVRLFDVAPFYGHGRAERFVGGALAARPRSELFLSTKVGRLLRREAAGGRSDFAETGDFGPVFDFSGDGVRRSLEESLERLGFDRVDALFVHDPDDHLAQALAEAYPAVERLRDEGVVSSVGVGTNRVATLEAFVRETDVDVVLLANRFTLLDRSGQDVLSLCAARGVDVVIGGVFNSGILADPSPGARYEYAPAPAALRARVVELAARCAARGVPLQAAALQFPFRHPAVRAVLVGARNPEEVRAAVDWTQLAVPEVLWDELDHLPARG
jgi:D-threo-aldose 1-dehydrogenase